jgi:hypothetical protein
MKSQKQTQWRTPSWRRSASRTVELRRDCPVLVLNYLDIDRLNSSRKNSNFCHSVHGERSRLAVNGEPRRAARRGISLFPRLNQREIPHFVRNDKKIAFSQPVKPVRLKIPTPFHRFHHRDFVGVFEVRAHGNPDADARHAHAERFEEL